MVKANVHNVILIMSGGRGAPPERGGAVRDYIESICRLGACRSITRV